MSDHLSAETIQSGRTVKPACLSMTDSRQWAGTEGSGARRVFSGYNKTV